METEMDLLWKFGKNATTAGVAEKSYLGGKGAGLVEMARKGYPVPPGIIIPTVLCPKIIANPEILKALAAQVVVGVKSHIGESLVSVRSGAPVSMPGMMDTILNVGIGEWNMAQYQAQMGSR